MELRSVRPTDREVETVIERYSKSLFRFCFSILRNSCDAEDAVSETMIKYISSAPQFNGEEHRKAWLITVARNESRNMLRSDRRHDHINIDDLSQLADSREHYEVLSDVLTLPEKYREALYLHYVEGYKVRELAKMLAISEFAVKKRLQYGRDKLRLEYGMEAEK